MEKYRLGALLGVLALLVMVAAVWLFSGQRRAESIEDLARQAIEGPTPEAQEKAAIRLEGMAQQFSQTGPRNPAQPHLCRILTTSKNPGVKAACMRALASMWDYECMPTLLELFDDESPIVRGAAAVAVRKLVDMGPEGFNPNDPPEKRAAVAQKFREIWPKFKEKKLPNWQRRLEEKDKETQL